MAKIKKIKNKQTRAISPDEAIEFLESIRLLAEQKDEPTKLISIRIPENILRSIKIKAKSQNKKYQSLIIEFLRQSLKSN